MSVSNKCSLQFLVYRLLIKYYLVKVTCLNPDIFVCSSEKLYLKNILYSDDPS